MLHTDGLIEGTRDVIAGLRELTRTAARMPGVPVTQFAQRLLTEVATCAREEDDCLAIVIRRPSRAAVQQRPSATAPPSTDALVRETRPHVSAVCHAATPVQLRLRRCAAEVLVEVEDALDIEPVLRAAEEEATGGRGMHLVAALAEHWGAAPSGDGKTVWCTVALQPYEDEGTLQRRAFAV